MDKFRFRIRLDNWPSFDLHFDRNYGIDRRKGWSVAIDGSFYVQFEKNPLAAVWRAVQAHKAAGRDMAEDDQLTVMSGAAANWHKAEYIRRQVEKYTGDWRNAFSQYRTAGTTGSVHVDCFIRDYDAAVAAAKELEAAHVQRS